jgi:hypothetical protein
MHAVLDLTADPLAFPRPAARPTRVAVEPGRVGAAGRPGLSAARGRAGGVHRRGRGRIDAARAALRARGTHALEVSGATGAAIVALAAGTQAREATLDEVERLFNRLPVSRRAACGRGLPRTGLALALLVLRETPASRRLRSARPVQ